MEKSNLNYIVDYFNNLNMEEFNKTNIKKLLLYINKNKSNELDKILEDIILNINKGFLLTQKSLYTIFEDKFSIELRNYYRKRQMEKWMTT